MNDNNSPTNNPWSSLSTVATFDRGNDTRTTIRLDTNNENQTNGQIIERVDPSHSLLIESLIQQLCTMFEGDTVRRNKLYFAICDKLYELKLIDASYNMMEFEMIRGQYQRALYHLVTVARASTGSESALRVPSCLMAEWSRYRREFQEINFIAGGGFGNVFKALHRLDGIEYAVKKIVVRSGRVQSIMQHLEEVKTLAKLNHTNIVSYKGAWIEPTLPSTFVPSLPSTSRDPNKSHAMQDVVRGKARRSYASNNIDTQSHSSTNSNKDSSNQCEYNRQDVSLSYNTEANYKTGKRIVEKSRKAEIVEQTDSDIVSFRSDSNTSKQGDNHADSNVNYTDASDSIDESESNQKICTYNSQMKQQYATLYIQMALCDKTLKQWLDERVDVTPPSTIMAILTQILCGLDYIHSRNIVHHDIKPSNIFISTTYHLHIQLGDFGLACPLQRENHHTVLGTHMYAAPEQLLGKCDPKSDVYSVGIVLLELLIFTKTDMERSHIIKDVKRGQIPTSLALNYPKWIHLVSRLVQEDPIERPSTSQLLQELNEDKDVIIAQLRQSITDKDNKIRELEEKIVILEALVANCKIPLRNS
ncbi:hypothetical protein KM043_014863 [Ampulex compressa]|nr:hypothetical protein KM043_014863 [Ampulex compressa]